MMPGCAPPAWAILVALAPLAPTLRVGAVLSVPGLEPAATPAAAATTPALGGLLLAAVALFAFVGYLRSAGRMWQTAAAAALAYAVLGARWDLVARGTNAMYHLFVFAVVRRGMLAPDPAAAWRSANQAAGLIRADSPVAAWQITWFAVFVAGGYLLGGLAPARMPTGASRRLDLRGLVGRLLGAALGGIAGYLSAAFVLARLFPTARPSDLAVGGAAGAAGVAALGTAPLVLVGVAALIFVLGVLSMGGRRKQVYD
jgi:hypothetical protein